MKLIIALLLLCAPVFGDTVIQTYECNLDVLSGETHQFIVEPFDSSLGTLVDVRYIVENPVLTCSVRMKNTTPNTIVSFSVQANVVPWLTDGETWWSGPSWAMSLIDRTCNIYPIFFPGWVHWFSTSFQFNYSSALSMIWPGKPDLSYYQEEPRQITLSPASWVSTCIYPYAPWPGTLRVLEFSYSQTWRIEYEYISSG